MNSSGLSVTLLIIGLAFRHWNQKNEVDSL